MSAAQPPLAICWALPWTTHIAGMHRVMSALAARGWEVTAIGPLDAGDMLRTRASAGSPAPPFHAIAGDVLPQGTWPALRDRVSRLTGMAAQRAMLDVLLRWMAVATGEAPALITRLGAGRAAVLVVDQHETMGGSIGRHLALPTYALACALPMDHDALCPPPDSTRQPPANAWQRLRLRAATFIRHGVETPLRRALNRHRRALGLPATSRLDGRGDVAALLSQLPTAIDFPRADPGPLIACGPFLPAAGIPPWSGQSAGTRPPRVYAALGRIFNDDAALWRTIAEAVHGTGGSLTIGLGGGADPGPLPGATRVLAHADQPAELAAADVFITHAGLASVLESLRAGVPMVALPRGADQSGLAARLVHHRLGGMLTARPSAAALAAALLAVHRDPAPRQRCRDLAPAVGVDGAARAAAAIAIPDGDVVSHRDPARGFAPAGSHP